MLKKFPPYETNVTKKCSLFSFANSSQFFLFTVLIRAEAGLSKTCMGFYILDSVSLLLKFIFLFNKKDGLFDFKMSQFFSKL